MKIHTPGLDQKGAALITGLLILVVLSILGIVTMQSSLLQERMAGNLEQRDIAFQRAEAGLRDGEAWLRNQGIERLIDLGFGVINENGVYSTAALGLWGGGNAFWTPNNCFVGGMAGSFYYIEFMGPVTLFGLDTPTVTIPSFRITSRGVSLNGRSSVILQTTFIR